MQGGCGVCDSWWCGLMSREASSHPSSFVILLEEGSFKLAGCLLLTHGTGFFQPQGCAFSAIEPVAELYRVGRTPCMALDIRPRYCSAKCSRADS